MHMNEADLKALGIPMVSKLTNKLLIVNGARLLRCLSVLSLLCFSISLT